MSEETNQYTVESLRAEFGPELSVEGQVAGIFCEAKSIDEAREDSITWVSANRPDKNMLVRKTRAAFVICDDEVDYLPEFENKKCLIRTKNPRLLFSRILTRLFKKIRAPGVHPTAVIHPEAKIHATAYIGPLCFIGKSEVGEGSVIVGHCHLYDNVILGRFVTLHAGVVVGAEGFGYVRSDLGELENFPHIGGVLIGDYVEIGANSCIDRGSLGNTHIRSGTKIGALVNIGHNVVIEEGVLIAGNSTVSGSTTVRRDSWLGPSSTLSNGIQIGEEANVAIGTSVVRDVPKKTKVASKPGQILPEAFWSKE